VKCCDDEVVGDMNHKDRMLELARIDISRDGLVSCL
jgi:hypothetical protein